MSEATPLLQSPSSSPVRSGDPWYSTRRLSSTFLIIPVVLGARLASSIPTSTTLYIVQQTVCRHYYLSHDPARIPVGGQMPDELCDAPDVQKLYSAIVAMFGIADAIACMIGYSALSYFSSTFGRKPAILLVNTLALSSNLFLLVSSYVSDDVAELVLLILWQLCGAFASLYLMMFLATTYVFDIIDPEERPGFLSKLYGAGVLGGALAFGFGGLLTTQTRNVLLVYGLAATISACLWVFVFFFLPESFTKEKRDEIRDRRAAESSAQSNGYIKQIVSKMGAVLAPLRLLKPQYNEQTGKRNWRLVWCALHVFLVESGGNYAVTIAIIFWTARYNYKPDDTGFFLAFVSLAFAISNWIVVPWVIKTLRPFYRRTEARRHPIAIENNSNDTETVSEATDHLDVHIAFVSWIIEAFGYILLSYMASKPGQFIGALVLALGAGKAPVFRSIVAASVEPLKQAETLAAIEMVGSIGVLISPLYMGVVFSMTITTMPSLVFYMNALIITLGASVLLLVKDSERYQAPRERVD